jgi:RimJ/RimL family protein N-acetyltransferase
VTYEHDRLSKRRNVKLRPREAEITHCQTPSEYRGKGYYPFAIRSLFRVAAELGIKRVFMITNAANEPSQRGIKKAGLTRQGSIRCLILPWRQKGRGLTLRTFRRPAST